MRRLAPVVVLCAAPVLFAQTLEQAERLWKERRFEEANNAFRAVAAREPRNADARVRWGRFLLDGRRKAPNKADAAALFEEALGIRKDDPGALLGLALVAAEDFDRKAVELARAALKQDPNLVEAHELLARLALEDNNIPGAIEAADKAIALSPDALDAMSVRATIDWLEGRSETPWLQRILARNPRYGQAYALAAYFFVINRRYEEGIALYRKALEIEPDLWSARSQLGINLMRLAQDQEARAQLLECYEHGFRDALTSNSLTLLDSYKKFVYLKTPRTVLKLNRNEADLLRPYFQAELDRALAVYDKKYRFKLERPVQVEVYPDHEDFAVRTLGLPGLGALGATFGYVVAMDSPSSRKPGSFHWASALWHELSHVYVLSATKHRAPRWFAEGMAVHEETAANPEWGDRLDPTVIAAIKEKKLLPVAELDRGFVRPSYPAQVGVSYFQAGRICDYINKNWGYDKLVAMMNDFGAGATTPEVFRKELNLEPGDFDKQFLRAIEAETKKTVDGFENWRKQLKETAKLAEAGKYDDVVRAASAIRDVYPEYVEAGSAYEFLADAYLAKQDKGAATAELERYVHAGGRNPDTLKKLASLLAEAGRKQDSAAVLDRINYIQPLDEDLHRRLGDLWLDLGNAAGAIREYQAVLARTPTDPAAAHFNLARALRTANRPDEAKEELLLALEAAPGYRPAQRMLLELSR